MRRVRGLHGCAARNPSARSVSGSAPSASRRSSASGWTITLAKDQVIAPSSWLGSVASNAAAARTCDAPDGAGLSPHQQRTPEIVEESLRDRDALRISRPWALKTLGQREQRLPTVQNLPPSDRPWAHPQGRHARFSLPYRQAQTAGETPTIPPPHQPGGAQRQLRARRWINPSCEIPVESVAADGGPHAHNSSLDRSGGGVV
jgi:hypothetical protein